MINKVAKYISKSHPITRRLIANAWNAAFPIFADLGVRLLIMYFFKYQLNL